MAVSEAQSENATGILLALAALFLLLHVAVGGRYGFHRDELATLEDARRLATGYVAYPPLTPFFGRISLELFGTSLRGFRFFAAFAQAVTVVLTGLMARELGGRRTAQIVAALSAGIAPVALASGALMQYVAFDYLWWILAAYLLIRLLSRDEPRLWLLIGAVVGLGMLTKYTMSFLVIGMLVGLLLTDARHYLKSRWLWLGVALSLLIFLPNLLWQIHHNFISLDFLKSIHARDIRWGRTRNFLPDQLKVATSLFTLPLWLAGLFFYLRAPEGERFRMIGWMFVVTLCIFIVARGRGYYLAPAYPMLLAAGAMRGEQWLQTLTPRGSQVARAASYAVLIAAGVIAAALVLPLAPVNSTWWQAANNVDGDFREEIGWQELVAEVARIRNSLPEAERAHAGILAANYGEAGALTLYGPSYGLPRVISGINSFWAYGYGDPPPQSLIVIGVGEKYRKENFDDCEVVGRVWNRYGIANEEMEHPEIYFCRKLRQSWPDFWNDWRYYG